MDLDKIRQLIDAMAKSDLAELEFTGDGWTLRLVRTPQRAAAASLVQTSPAPSGQRTRDFAPTTQHDAPETGASTNAIVAPLSGVVYLAPAPAKPPFVVAGQAIKAGTPVCVIEAMKVFNEVRADTDGTIEAVLVTSGHEVEAGQPLVRLTRAPA